MSDRVEELESTVVELRAAVDGLTEELVETRERLRQLEEERDVGASTRTAGPADAGRVDTASGSDHAEPEQPTDADERKTDTDASGTDDEDAGTAGDDEIIVA